MVWFQVDDNLAFHPKVIEAGNGAMGLWVRGGAWCMANLTDGYLPARVAYQLGTKSMCNRLVNVGLFEEGPDGYRFHDWYDKQLTKTEVEARRRRDRDRKADLRKRHLAPVSEPNPDESDFHLESERNPSGIRAESTTNPSGVPRRIPTQPNPTPFSGHLGEGTTTPEPNTETPPPESTCSKHPDGTDEPCIGCRDARIASEHYEYEQTMKRAAETLELIKMARAEIARCPHCDEQGWIEVADGVARCSHHNWQVGDYIRRNLEFTRNLEPQISRLMDEPRQ